MAKFVVEGDVDTFKRKAKKYDLGCVFVEMVKEKAKPEGKPTTAPKKKEDKKK